MPRWGPVKRQDLIRYLRQLSFDGPFAGAKHQFMQKGSVTVVLPNPHRGDIGRELLSRVLRQGGIAREVWEQLP